MKNIFFNSSLPRSGSTLISNLVAQNPNIYTTPTSGLADLILNAKNTYAHSQAILSQDKEVMERAFLGFCRAGMQGFFNNITSKEFIVDKSNITYENCNSVPYDHICHKTTHLIYKIHPTSNIQNLLYHLFQFTQFHQGFNRS